MNYFKLAIKGLSWLTFLQVSIRGLTFVKFIVVVRLLTPSQIGIYTIVAIVLGFFEVVTELGIDSFIINQKGSGIKYLSAAWLISLIRGLLLFILMLVTAFPAAIFFRQDSLFNLLIIASFILLMKGGINPAVAYFTKRFQFSKEYWYSISITASEVVSAIIFVIILKSPLALVLSLMISTFVELTLSFTLVREWPSLRIERKKIIEILHFSKWITLTGLITYLSSELDSILVGRLLGASDLGIYQISQKFSLQLLSEGGDVITKVIYPIFASVKSSKQKLNIIYNKTVVVVGGISFLAGLVLFISAKPFISVFIGNEYEIAALVPFRIFLILGVLTVVMAIITSLFLSLGRQVYTARLVTLRFFAIAIILYPLTRVFGLVGASTASLLSFICIYPLAIYFNRKIFK